LRNTSVIGVLACAAWLPTNAAGAILGDADVTNPTLRVNAIATHTGDGGFCYSFVRQAPPAGHPSDRPNGNELGKRATASP